MLLGAAAMIALVADRGYDRRLIVSPAVGGDAGALADLRARTIGGSQKPCGERALILEVRDDLFAVMTDLLDAGRNERHAHGFRFLRQRGDEKTVLDHMGERLARR